MLVVFLSGDLAGPQAVVVVDVANGANLAGTLAPQVATAPDSSSQPTAVTANPPAGSTLSTVVVPTTATASTAAPTAAGQPDQPTQAQQDTSSSSGKVAGIIVGAIVAAMLLAMLGPMLWNKIRSRSTADGRSIV